MFRSVNNTEKILALGLVLMGVFFRLLPHPENFTPTMAIAVFAGVVLPAALSLTVPIAIMMISDSVIGFHPLFLIIWSSFFLVSLLGNRIRNSAGWRSVSAATMACSVLFFIVSNLSVFLFEHMYPKTWAGLAECFTMALPFFRNSFLADVFYCFALFGLFALARGAARKVAYARS